MRPAIKDEMIFLADGFISIDPSLGLRAQAQSFVRSRQWSTPSIFHGDQPEADDLSPGWSLTFGLGLDHVPKTTADWFSDIAAIVEFLQPVARETCCEFILEFRLRSRLWYSETLAHIGDQPDDRVDLAALRTMLQHFTQQQRWSWWRKIIGQ